MKKTSFLIACLIQLIFLGSCSTARVSFPTSDHSIYDVPYASGYPGDEAMKLDAHFPDGAHGLPVLVYIHGGGWTEGDKSQMDPWARRMSARGYVVFNVNYRLAPQYPFPAAVNDCLGALAWVREHAAEYGGDASRLGVTGGSAGGHLTALVSSAAGDPFWKPTGHETASLAGAVKAQVPFFGVYDFSRNDVIHWIGLNRKFLGGTEKQLPENYRLASPINFVKSAPPTLLVCGKLDPLYPPQSNLYYRALREAGVEAEYVKYPFETHGFDFHFQGKDSRDAFDRMMEFFDRHL
ncbi:MAG TPA: alpha/beta hydrolase [bacterium]|nr:alpha/beta hydrolase [bacterium]